MTRDDMPRNDFDDRDVEPTMIRPPNRIKDKVALGGQIDGDGFDPALLQQAEANADALHDQFVDLADSDIDGLHLACDLAGREPQSRAEHLQAVQRRAHELKGYGTNIGYELLTIVADSLSKFLLRSEPPVDAKLQVARVHVDTIRLIFRQQMTGDGGEAGQKLLDGLVEAVAKYQ